MTRNNLFRIAVVILVGAALTGIYLLTPLKDLITVDNVKAITSEIPQSPLTVLVFMLAFFIGGATLVPMPLLALAVSLVFPVWLSVLIVIPGFALAATGGYLTGRLLDMRMFGDYVTRHTDKVQKKIHGRVIYAVFALRIAPTPPFTITSMLSGLLRVTFIPYVIGSVAGIMPLGIGTVFFGRGAIELIKNPSVMALSSVIAAFVLVSVYYLIKRNTSNEQ